MLVLYRPGSSSRLSSLDALVTLNFSVSFDFQCFFVRGGGIWSVVFDILMCVTWSLILMIKENLFFEMCKLKFQLSVIFR